MSRKRSEAAMRSYEAEVRGGRGGARGRTASIAQRVYDQIVGFSGFGFPKSHSAAFGLLAYQSTWLRVHYGPEFLCALLNEQPMGFYPPDALVHEAQRREIEVRPPCVAAGDAECRVEPGGAVRIGLGYVNGVKEAEVKALVAERERGGRFRSIPDLGARSGAGAETLAKLAWAGACDALLDGPEEGRRRQALWLLGVAAPGVPLGRHGAQRDPARAAARSPRRARAARAGRLGAAAGRLRLDRRDAARAPAGAHAAHACPGGRLSSADLERTRHGAPVRVAGLVVARQRPATAKGVTFMLLEDEHGTINLIVPPPVHERCRLAVRGEALVIADGRLERREGVTNVLVHDVRRLERARPAAGRGAPHRATAHVVQRLRGGDPRGGGGGAA